MANNAPHVAAAQEPEAQKAVIDREPERPTVTVPVTSVPISKEQNGNAGKVKGAQADLVPANPVSKISVNPPPAHVNPANANPVDPSPPPSRSNAVWLAITLLNLVLIVFLLPTSLLKSEQLSLIIKVVTIVGAAGAFAAGLVWFQNLATSLPNRRWFKALNIVLLCTLMPANVSQMSIVPVRAQIESGTTLEIDGKLREYDGGAVMLSVKNHKIKVSPSDDHKGKPCEYRVTFKEMVLAIFRGYQPRWTPFYLVYLNTEDPDVDVVIRKTDGEFDEHFRRDPEPSKRGYLFKPQPEANDTFIYRGGPNPTGSEDVLHLPYGEYQFVVERKEGCKESKISRIINKGEREGYIVDFGPLCETR